MENYQTNPKLELAANFIRYTNKHLFLTGKAGTGKTTFLRNLKNITFKRHVVVAPTGVAAINAGGVTIHSFFQLPFGPQIPEELAKRVNIENDDARQSAARFQRFTREKINIIKSIDLLVIDEISMVRADMLDAIDAVLRRYRNREIPFGGVQLLMIGDLQQLAPIAKEDEWKLLRDYYDSVYFFSSKALQGTDYVSIELTNIYRQSDLEFIRLLGKIRENNLDDEAIAMLKQRFIPNFNPGDNEGYITLTTHNYQSKDINAYRLDQLKGKIYEFTAEVSGEFPEYNYPTDEMLKLKIGAQVMFVKNDPSPLKQFFNGKIGKIISIEDDIIYVKCPDEDHTIEVSPLEWQNCRYSLDNDSKEITETVIGSFKQYPLKLAWAVTIHKSQGLTFDKAIIDARQAFAHGQVYVALSRCRTLEGMVLSTGISQQAIKTDFKVGDFVKRIEENAPDEQRLEEAKNAYQYSLVKELFDFTLFHRRLSYLEKIIRDTTGSFNPGTANEVGSLNQKLKTKISQVAEKFMAEVDRHILSNRDIENNGALQERIKKACNYFAPAFETDFISAMPDTGTDNKVIRKSVEDLMERLSNEATIKLACMQQCKNGFSVAAYLENRAKASIEPQFKKRKQPADLSEKGVKHPGLLSKVKAWRDDLAMELDVNHYQVISRQAMFEIAEQLPLSRKELLEIKGIGQKKIKKYGDELLGMIREYIEESEIKETVNDAPLLIKRKEKKPDSKLLSFTLFNQGKTIAEVAQERGLAISTIEGHLSHFVGTGEIPVEKLLPAEKLSKIQSYFSETGDMSLGPAKTVLGDEVSWGELRFVIKHLEWKQGEA